MTWILIGAGVLGLVILAVVAFPLLGKLADLRRAGERLQRRQAEATTLQTNAEQLQQTLLGLEQRTGTMQERLALIKAGHGEPTGKHAWLPGAKRR
ncbi:hypothetical protein [Actinoplanes sp. NBRC 103695]|uniref:hypothetical protein n=1 Tax=Actinoplanes sp. NBRC 103695 TaxID=3032202 RepID=UPI0025564947|nr:hypothetical protein [Actinoplanes sp. NBRC 103695]